MLLFKNVEWSYLSLGRESSLPVSFGHLWGLLVIWQSFPFGDVRRFYFEEMTWMGYCLAFEGVPLILELLCSQWKDQTSNSRQYFCSCRFGVLLEMCVWDADPDPNLSKSGCFTCWNSLSCSRWATTHQIWHFSVTCHMITYWPVCSELLYIFLWIYTFGSK